MCQPRTSLPSRLRPLTEFITEWATPGGGLVGRPCEALRVLGLHWVWLWDLGLLGCAGWLGWLVCLVALGVVLVSVLVCLVLVVSVSLSWYMVV